jgi:hypothetical protein
MKFFSSLRKAARLPTVYETPCHNHHVQSEPVPVAGCATDDDWDTEPCSVRLSKQKYYWSMFCNHSIIMYQKMVPTSYSRTLVTTYETTGVIFQRPKSIFLQDEGSNCLFLSTTWPDFPRRNKDVPASNKE